MVSINGEWPMLTFEVGKNINFKENYQNWGDQASI